MREKTGAEANSKVEEIFERERKSKKITTFWSTTKRTRLNESAHTSVKEVEAITQCHKGFYTVSRLVTKEKATS